MTIRNDVIAALAYLNAPATQASLAIRGLIEIAGRVEVGNEVTFLDLTKVASPEHYLGYEKLTGDEPKSYQQLFGLLTAKAIGPNVSFVGISATKDASSPNHLSLNIAHPEADQTQTSFMTFATSDAWTPEQLARAQTLASQFPYFIYSGDSVSEADFLNRHLPLRELLAADTLAAMDAYIGNSLPQGSNKAAHSRNVAIGVVVALDFLCKKLGIPELDNERKRAVLAAGQLHDGGVIHNLAKIHLPLFNGQSAFVIASNAAAKLKQASGADLEDFQENEVALALCASAVAARGDDLFKAASKLPEIGGQVGEVRNFFKAKDVHNPLDLWRRIMYYVGGADFAKHHDAPTNALFSGIDANTAVSQIAIIVDMTEGAFGDARTLDEAVIDLVGYAYQQKGDQAYLHALLEAYGSGASFPEQWLTISERQDAGTRNVLRLHPVVRHLDTVLLLKALEGDKEASTAFPQALSSYGAWSGIDGFTSLKEHLASGGTVAGFVSGIIAEFPELTDARFKDDMAGLALERWVEKRAVLRDTIMDIANAGLDPDRVSKSLTRFTGSPVFARQNLMDSPLLAFLAAVKERNPEGHPVLQGWSKAKMEELDKRLLAAASLTMSERAELLLKDRQSNRNGAFTNFVSIDTADPFNSKAYKMVRSVATGGGIDGMGGLMDPQDNFDPSKTVRREIGEEAREAAKLAGDAAKTLGDEIVTELASAKHRKLARFHDDKHFNERGWGYVVNSFGHVTRINSATAEKIDRLTTMANGAIVDQTGQEVSGLVSYTLREAPAHLLRHHYPHAAITEMMGFAVELHESGIKPEVIWNHYANYFTGEGEYRQQPLRILAKRAGLVLDDMRTEFLTAVDNAIKGNDTFHNISVENYAKAHYQGLLNERYFALPNMALYGKMPIRVEQVKVATSSGEIDPPREGDTTTPFTPGDYIIHPLKRDESGALVLEAGKPAVDYSKGHVIKGEARFNRLYRLDESSGQYASLNRGFLYWLDEPTNIRPAWDVHKPQAIYPGGGVYKSATVGEIYGMPAKSATDDYARLSDDGQVICRLNEPLQEQHRLLVEAHLKGVRGSAAHLDDLKVLYDIAQERWPENGPVARPVRVVAPKAQLAVVGR